MFGFGLLGNPNDVQAQEMPQGGVGLLGMTPGQPVQPLQQQALAMLQGGKAMGGAQIGRFDPRMMQAAQAQRDDEEKAKQMAQQWLMDTRNQPEGGNTEGPN